MAPSYLKAASIFAAVGLLVLGSPVRAADPYEINAILPLTGNLAFVGTTNAQALKAIEGYVNRNGGIGGRPLSFVIADDQSDPKNSLQLAQGLIAKNVPVILGPASPQSCAAIAPVIEQNGPVLYCLANAGHPLAGGYEFLTLFPYESQFAVVVRYFRERGLKRFAYVIANDAGGQDAEKAFLSATGLPENKSVEIVAHEYFTPGDLSIAAQMQRIKTVKPDVVLMWATGAPAGTMFRNAQDLNLDLPTVTSPGNLNAAFFKQYGSRLPSNLYFAAVPYYADDTLANSATKAAVSTMTGALAALNAKPDMLEIAAWDPAMVVVDALRKLGPDTSAAKLHAYLVGLRGWTGVNGPYDFRLAPQRGLSDKNIEMVRWDAQRNTVVPVSKFGGSPLAAK